MTTNTPYGQVGLALADKEIDWAADDIKVMLVNGYTFNKDTHVYLDDGPRAAEVPASGGYTTDGESLGTKTAAYDSANDRTNFGSAAVAWDPSTITATGAVIYVDTGTDSTSALICFVDFEETKESVGAKFEIAPTGGVWFRIAT